MFDCEQHRQVAIVGDTHSKLSVWADTLLPAFQAAGITQIYSAGDFESTAATDHGAYNFVPELEKLLAKLGMRVDYVDGNHDRHSHLLRLRDRQGDWCRQHKAVPRTDHIAHLPRGLGWQVGGVRFLAAGGAYSIDMASQFKRGVYDVLETISDADVRRAQPAGVADIVIAHDCPMQVDLQYFHDQAGRTFTRANSPQTDKNRRRLSQIVANAQATTVFHGHYHLPYQFEAGGLKVVGLGADGKQGSYAILDSQTGQIRAS